MSAFECTFKQHLVSYAITVEIRVSWKYLQFWGRCFRRGILILSVTYTQSDSLEVNTDVRRAYIFVFLPVQQMGQDAFLGHLNDQNEIVTNTKYRGPVMVIT